MKRKFQHKVEVSPLMGNMGEEEIEGPAGDQHSPESSPSSSSDPRDQQDVESRANRLISPCRADFIDGTPPMHIRQQSYSDRQAELEGERERLLEKEKSSPNSVDRWLKLLRDRDKLLRLSFCKENASILEGQIQRLENLCKSVERLALCPDPLVEQFCITIGDLIKLCPLVLAHVRNPSLHDHMERGQSPLQPSAPSPQHSWVENERRMSDFSKGKMSPSNDEMVGSPTCTPPKYSSTQNVGEAMDAFKVGTSIWSPLTPDNSNNTNHIHIQSAENSLIGSYFALPAPNTSLQECSTPGSMLSVSNPFINRQVTLSTQTSPMLRSIESGELPDMPVYKTINLNSSTHDSSINNINTSSAYTDSDFPTLSRKKTYASKIKTRSNTDSFKSVFNNPSVNCLTLQKSPLLKFANTKDMTIFKNNDYTPVLNIADLKTKSWCKVKNRRKKKKKTATEDMSSTEDNTPEKDIQSPPKRARINFEYDDDKVTQALVAAIQNLGQPSRYILLDHMEPTMV